IMLIFKDPILGFMAGIQLSANKMLALGDWLEMPKYDANGDVIDITLTTVKVQNWDNTITTVPTYALISDSFKNWRGMQETGGRRISRSVLIDIASIHFLSGEECAKLRQNPRINPFIPPAAAHISTKEHTNPSPCTDHQNMTNSQLFRRYLTEYIRSHPGIHPGLIQMVRLLQPTAQGLPLQIYAFAAKTDWVSYEKIQSDIFDHILAVAPEFNLTLFQNPAGRDIRSLSAAAASKSGEKS
ncbi:MAG: mechanosensitive ion channel family protein, partial [Fibrobacterota bacterium]